MKEPRFPKQQPKGICRGCLAPVPKGRQTWCSGACQKKNHPFFVKQAVRKRDAGDGSDAFRKTLSTVLHQACDQSEKGESILDHALFFEAVMGLFSSQIFIGSNGENKNNNHLVSSTVSALKKAIGKLEGVK